VTVLLKVAMPGCLQQFINHNGVLHKVYVMGDQVHTVCLPYFSLMYAGLLTVLVSVRTM